MREWIVQGGPVLWALLVVSVLAVFVFLNKLLQLHRAQIHSRDFLDGIYNVLRRGNAVEAVTICEDTPGPVAQLVRAAILQVDDNPEEMSKAIQHAGLAEIPRLEHRLNLLATLGKIAPMLGLLGTVLGFIQVFVDMQRTYPATYPSALAGGMGAALLTTAVGLTIAIPIYAGYNLLVSRIEALVLDMEYAAAEIYSFLIRNRALFTKD